MTTPLETALRDMLRERATDIDALPARLAHVEDRTEVPIDEEVLDARPARHSAWLLAAAVALIVAVAGAVVGIRQLSSHDTPPATPNSVTPTSTPASTSPSPTKSPGAAEVPLACKATLPNAWQDAFRSEPQTLDAQSASPLAVSSDGTEILAARDFGSRRDVVLSDARGHVRVIYTVPEPDLNMVMSGSMEGNWVVLNLSREPRNANGVDATDIAVVLVDRRNATVKNLDTVSESQYGNGGKTINQALLYDGHVYWDVRPTYRSKRAKIEDYDIATGKQRVIFAGKTGWLWPTATPLGVSWRYPPDATIDLPAPLPAKVKGYLGGLGPDQTASDGRAYAWVNPVGVLHWWSPGLSAPRQVRVPRLGGANHYTAGMMVAGQFVMVDNKIIDMRTGAWAAEPKMSSDSRVPFMTADGVLIANELTGAFVGTGRYPEPATGVVRFDTRSLPDLHC